VKRNRFASTEGRERKRESEREREKRCCIAIIAINLAIAFVLCSEFACRCCNLLDSFGRFPCVFTLSRTVVCGGRTKAPKTVRVGRRRRAGEVFGAFAFELVS
jgi:hypothetical protein